MTGVSFPTVNNICRWCEMQDQGSGSISQSVSSAAAAMSISYPVNFIKNANCRAESARILQTAPRGVRSGSRPENTQQRQVASRWKIQTLLSVVACMCGGCGGGNRFAEIMGQCSERWGHDAPSESYQFIPGQNTPNTAQ